jgi:hypothetical protein
MRVMSRSTELAFCDLDLLAGDSTERPAARQDGALPCGPMPSLNPRLLLESGYWFNGNPGPPSPITYALLAFFVVVLAVSVFVWRRRRQLFPNQRVKTRLAARLGPWFAGIALTGVVLMLLRVVEFPILSGRILWLLCVLALVALGAYVAFYMVRRYPAEVARLAREEERQRWVPKPRRRGGRRR